ncbi:MAG: PhzF family phenazine biosynthesis protein [SAR324 cluster bacterium]|nr:PhzF family phenazine biosynthesis protein [SAR324 cluster bacterium]
MAKLHYQLVDVFTGSHFGGNPLAVFPDGPAVPERYYQRIANELNLSETTYVLPPTDGQSDVRVRIFTPREELPFAGHPTLGTAFVLAREDRISGSGAERKVVFELGVGPTPVELRYRDGAPHFITMSQPLPQFGPEVSDRGAIAAMLSLAEDDLLPGAPCHMISCGLPFLFVPLRGLEAVGKVRVKPTEFEAVLESAAARAVYAFTMETEQPGSTVHGRMFGPALGVKEDPATGSANGPLGCYLLRHGLAEGAGIVSEQGFEMGRPSLLYVDIGQEEGEISSVRVGGQCVAMGGGWFELP